RAEGRDRRDQHQRESPSAHADLPRCVQATRCGSSLRANDPSARAARGAHTDRPRAARAFPERTRPIAAAPPMRVRSDLALAPAEAAASPTAAATRRPLARLAHGERAAAERLAVQGLDGRLCLSVRGHLDEGEAAGPTRLPVGHDLHFLDLASVLLEERAQLALLGLVREVADVQSLSHASSHVSFTRTCPPSPRAYIRPPSSMHVSPPSRRGGTEGGG